jgi:leader peptidase (prepilin peptidase)/N-methyltransferase
MLLAVALAGLVVGSFVDVAVGGLFRDDHLLRGERPFRGEPLASARCPGCAAQPDRPALAVVTWVANRGRCPACRGRLGVRGPVLELSTAVLFVTLYARLAANGQLAAAPAVLAFAAVGLALALIDAVTQRLPDWLVLPSYPVLAALLTVASGLHGDWWPLARALIGGGVLFGFFLVMALTYPAGLGFGDVKFAGLIGGVLAYLSWSALIRGVFAGFLFAAVVGVGLLVARRASGRTQIAFGPFLILGALVAVLVPSG